MKINRAYFQSRSAMHRFCRLVRSTGRGPDVLKQEGGWMVVWV